MKTYGFNAMNNSCNPSFTFGASFGAKINNFVHAVLCAVCTFILSLSLIAIIIKGAVISVIICVCIVNVIITAYNRIGPNKYICHS